MLWFGETWHAPICEVNAHIETPIGERCTKCAKRIFAGDRGLAIPYASWTGPIKTDEGMIALGRGIYALYHLACFLRTVGIKP